MIMTRISERKRPIKEAGRKPEESKLHPTL
jgi:hypothetical protein